MSHEGIMQETEQHQVDFVSLGEGNHGQIGPSVLAPDLAEQARADLGKSEYDRPASLDWDCVDMRSPANALVPAKNEGVAAHMPGGLVITDAAADMMLPENSKLSQLIVSNTKRAVEDDGQAVTVHGDSHAGKAGCGANKLLANRDVLKSNLANASIVAPLAWDVARIMNLPILAEDISAAIVNGGRHAANDELWDVTPEQVVDLIAANGGRYIELAGEHHEAAARLQLDNGSFDKIGFARDHQDVGVFAASLGRFSQYTFERYGEDRAGAAQHVLGAILFTIGACKGLGNDSLDVAIVKPTQA